MYKMDINKIHGIIPPIITPIDRHENVDEEGLRLLIDHCIRKGLHGIFVAGTNGESMALTQEQRNKAIQIALDEVKGKMPVFCGVMDTSTRRVIDNLKALEQFGGEIAVVTTVFYSRNSCRSEIIRHFEEISKRTDISIFLYNIPQFTHADIQPDIVIELSEIDNIIGIKDSSGNFHAFQKYISHFSDKTFKLFQGYTDLTGISILIGADGVVPVLAPLFPEIFIHLYNRAKEKDIPGTMLLQKMICKTSDILSMSNNATSAAKYAISRLGYCQEHVTRPCEPVSFDQKKRIQAYIETINTEYQALKERLSR
jgi:4-hydroxy-tetrahydrodipicolinate synthase